MDFLKSTLLFLSLSIISSISFAQNGVIKGKMIDSESGEELIGANVVIEGTTTGTSSDIDGNYQFQAEPGTYTLLATYIGYPDMKVTGVEVKAGETTTIDFVMQEQVAELGLDIVVEAEMLKNNENAMLALQRKSDKVQDGISSQEMSRYATSNAAGAMKKVTGASVVDGKFIYVRGLGDRYTTAQLNGQQLPSTDPYRNSVQLDLIPSNLLDNIVASKTFTPDLPGNFTGGNVNLTTKAFPERMTVSVSTSMEYNTNASFNSNFLTYEGGKLDAFGFDDGNREIPSVLTNAENLELLRSPYIYILARNDEDIANLVDASSKGLNSQMTPTATRSPMNYGLSFSIGNQLDIAGKPLGILFSAQHKRSFSHINNGALQDWELNDGSATALGNRKDFVRTQSTESPSVGGMLGLTYQLSKSDEISFTALYNHDAEKMSRFEYGTFPQALSDDAAIYQANTLYWKERALQNYQLKGEHVLLDFKDLAIDWSAGFTQSSQDEPDYRFFANTYSINENTGDSTFFINPAEYQVPFHFFRNLTDKQYNSNVDFTLPILQSKSKSNKIKFGSSFSTKDRVFNENRFYVRTPYTGNTLNDFDGDAESYFAPENTGIIGLSELNGQNLVGNYVTNATRPINQYTGSETIWGVYAMGTYQVLSPLKVIAGVRVEGTNIQAESADENAEKGEIDVIDFLPSVNAIYALNDNMNIRAGYSRTLARPNMREISPFESYDGLFITLGNANLDRTLVHNADLRWEMYLENPGDMFAVSGYYKNFKNPIIKTYVPEAANTEFKFVNVPNADVYGVEFEIRKNLGFITKALSDFRFGTNISIIKSVVAIDETELAAIRTVNPDAKATRQFQGQSPFLINANLVYSNSELGLDASAAFNIFGDRLSENGQNGTPDVFEKGRGSLDFTVSKNITETCSIKLSATNLLNANYERNMTFLDTKYIIEQYRRGRSFGVSFTYRVQ